MNLRVLVLVIIYIKTISKIIIHNRCLTMDSCESKITQACRSKSIQFMLSSFDSSLCLERCAYINIFDTRI